MLDAALLTAAVLLASRQRWPSSRLARYLRCADERPLNSAARRAANVSFSELLTRCETTAPGQYPGQLLRLLDRYVETMDADSPERGRADAARRGAPVRLALAAHGCLEDGMPRRA